MRENLTSSSYGEGLETGEEAQHRASPLPDNRLFGLNRRVFKAYLLKESLERLWDYHYEGAMLNYLQKWIDQLKWQRLKPFEALAEMLLKHLDGIVNYCRTKVRFGVVEAVNGGAAGQPELILFP